MIKPSPLSLDLLNPWLITETLLVEILEQIVAEISAVPQKGRIADFGCGDFRFSRLFIPLASEFYGIDNWLASDYHEKVPAGVQFYWASVDEAPFADNSLDIVIFTEAIEHVASPKQALSEIKRVLVPGGIFVLSCPFMFLVHGAPNDFRRYTILGLDRLLKHSGFRLTEFYEMGDFVSTMLNSFATYYSFNNKRRRLARACVRIANFSFLAWRRNRIHIPFRRLQQVESSQVDRRMPIGYVVIAKRSKEGHDGNDLEGTSKLGCETAVVCPRCKGRLLHEHGCQRCENCMTVFPLFQGIPVLMRIERANLENRSLGVKIDPETLTSMKTRP